MYHAESYKEKLQLFLKIAWPIIITQMSMALMNLVDTIMAGRVGTHDLAGVAIGTSLWSPVFTGMNGVLLAITPMIAQHLGRGQSDRIHHTVTQAIYLASLIGMVIILAGMMLINPVLLFMDLEPGVSEIAKGYLGGLAIGIIPLFIANVYRNFHDGHGFTRITMFITVLAVPFNILINYSLIFGRFGLPQLGGVGVGYATGITFWIILITSIIVSFKVDRIRHYKVLVDWVKPSLSAWKEQMAIGLPIGLSIFFEASIFSVVTLLIGSMFSTTAIAANQIVISFTTLIFMIPLSLSKALTIVVGFSVGGERFDDAKQYSFLGIYSSIGILATFAVVLFFLRDTIAGLYSNDPEVIAFASQLFLIAMIYQLSDAAQSSIQGVLRGYKDVQAPFLIAIVSYWLVGIPIGYSLAAFTNANAFGLWIGISLGLTGAAVGFLLRLRYIYRQQKAMSS
ncbi:multidrug resistance protein, MATE family [Pelagirhabdus alkalitolerans]|uniref:Probable multidrug resistance protein NorM n=1 Tax=Pelagirhabdus alkalitolerans TaxID=1612202 RepID=A0A1G6LD27_9BACI|nr:MATE family efflux transporter [Pelagirhabdus alkalitolerans]SDC41179.1 multidrug resistance protein, MATE family [Pelagirhabdus alkalitolerans]